MADTQITGTLSADEPISGGLSANEGINAELTSDEEISGTLEVKRTQEIVQAVWGTITGTLSDQTDLQGALDGKADLENGKVPSSQLPSYVDDVLEYASLSAFPATGESGKIYIALDTNKTYRWSGSTYVEISESLALGETTGTAYEGSKGKANADAIAKAYKTDDSAETDIQDADYIPFYDTSASAKRKSLWSNIKAKLNEVFFRRSENNILGAKNLLPLTDIVSSGSIWTIMGDGTVVANGTPSENATFTINIPEGLSGNFLFSGCPEGGTGATYDLYPWDATTSARPKKWDGTTACASDYGGTSQEIQIPSGHRVKINCRVYGNFTANNLVFKPMLRLATDTDDTFEPFAMTNKELTDRVENQLAATEEELRDTVGWTCKNLIALPPVGTVQETNGITFTVRSDGGVSVVGTSTAGASFVLTTDKLYAGEYTASCIFDGTSDLQYPIFSQTLYAQDGTTKQVDYMPITNYTLGEKTKSIEGTDYLGNIVIYVASGKTVDQILYPMIRKAGIKDSTFEPYHGTVDEVKADKSSLATVATSGDYEDLENVPALADVATSGSYNDLEDTPTIPDELSDLSDDETHRLVTDTEKDAWNDKADNSVIAPVESGTTASQAYAVGEHFIKDGAFCTAKTAIASGATFTLDTNYTAGTIGNSLKGAYSTSGLSFTSCSHVAGGYARVGNLVVVNIRFKPTITTTSQLTISGFPKVDATANVVAGIFYQNSSSIMRAYNLTTAGVLNIFSGQNTTNAWTTDNSIISFAYITSEA